IKVIQDCLENSAFIMGDYIKKIEKNVSDMLNVKHCIGVSSGTDALYIPLLHLGIKPGDEIITTPFTFIATAEVISLLGAKPVFVDIEDVTYNMDSSKLEKYITQKTKAIIPVHLYGHPADMDPIMELSKKHKIFVIEDCCQAICAEYKNKKVGSIGDCGALSFFPSKNLGCFGDGGMITTQSEELNRIYSMIRVHGQEKRYIHEVMGINGRLDNIQAAVLTVRIKRLQDWITDRIRIAKKYCEELKTIGEITVPQTKNNCKHVFNQFTVRINKKRDIFQNRLNESGVPTAVHYPIPLHLQPAFKYLGYSKNDFPVSEKISEEVISLPIFPGMTEQQQSFVIDSIKKTVKTL
ncbi:DegT/DnrJ/EryC1/StrS family aminotransferase, partial [Candidatus Dependentiae bacterium]|nr:DegT/DnrJ/EryC1/StrS family aminotransferase [Candidatus Dependentiae bacterium]